MSAEGIEPLDADELRRWINGYVHFQSERDLDVFVLWVLHTHVHRQSWTTPRLLLTSAKKGAGKSTALTVIRHLGYRTRRAGASVTVPVLRDTAGQGRTMALDELGKWSASAHKVAAALINDGFDSEGTTPINVPGPDGSWVIEDVPTFAPLAAAGLLHEIDMADDVASRWITLYLRPANRAVGSIKSGAYRRGRDQWAERITAWAKCVELPDPDTLPVGSRHADKWNPIRQVAMTLGQGWPDRVEAAVEAEELVAEEPGAGAQLAWHEWALVDSWGVWLSLDQEQLTRSEVIVNRLAEHQPERWGEQPFVSGARPAGKLTQRRYADMVKQFGIVPKRFRESGEQVRGYEWDDFRDGWDQYGEFLFYIGSI